MLLGLRVLLKQYRQPVDRSPVVEAYVSFITAAHLALDDANAGDDSALHRNETSNIGEVPTQRMKMVSPPLVMNGKYLRG